MKAFLTACIISISIPLVEARAQEWIDITNEYLKNPGFNNNSNTGWTYTSDASAQRCTYETMEFWNGTFDIYQIMDVPNGKYRIGVQAYFRSAQENSSGYNTYISGKEVITGYLYANNDRTELASIFSSYLTENYAGGCWGTPDWGTNQKFYPNTMESGSYMFGKGMYHNTLETEVIDGKLRACLNFI